MELQYKADLAKVLQRFEAWWQCELIDRPLVTLGVRADASPKRPWPARQHATLRDRWMDAEYAVDCAEASMDGQAFFAESVPAYHPNLGPDVCATLFGCELEFGEQTSWSVPVAKSIRDVPRMEPDFQCLYWQTLRRMTDLSIERGKGKWITGITDLHMDGDLLAALRDPQELALDMADDLEGVAAACEHVTQFYPAIYEDLYGRIAAAAQPTTTWLPYLHAGKAYVTSCDFICMISPKMFQRAILPSIVEEMRYLERNVFHLDGPGALRHLDALLELEELDGLQWVYGAGNGPSAKWIDVYKKAQAAGKCLQIAAEDLSVARAIGEQIRPEGVWFTVSGQYGREEAQGFCRWLERWAAGKEG